MVLKSLKILIMVIVLSAFIFSSYSDLHVIHKEEEYVLVNQQIIDSVLELQKLIPKYILAYQDIIKLAKRIQHVSGVRDEELAFIYSFLVFKYCSKYNLDPVLVASVIHTESRFRQNSVGGRSKGLMQINSSVWRLRDYFDSEENIKVGSRILYMYRNSNPKEFLKLYVGVKENIEKGEQYEERVKQNYNKFDSASFAFRKSKKFKDKAFNWCSWV